MAIYIGEGKWQATFYTIIIKNPLECPSINITRLQMIVYLFFILKGHNPIEHPFYRYYKFISIITCYWLIHMNDLDIAALLAVLNHQVQFQIDLGEFKGQLL